MSIVEPTPESEAELAFEGALRPKSLREFVGQPNVRRQLEVLLKAAALQQRTPDHILLAGPPGLGKTTLAMIVARGVRPAAAHVERAGHPARRRPRGGAVLADARRGALHRRDPPDGPQRRGDALPRDGGLPHRHHGRQGCGRHVDPARPRAVHPRRRDHAVRPAAEPAPRPVRLHREPRVLRAGRARAGARPRRAAARPRRRTAAPSPRSPAAAVARPASRTGCCAASATSRSSTAAPSTTRPSARRSSSTTWTTAGSTGSTAQCSTRSSPASTAAPSGSARSPRAWGRSRRPSNRSSSRSSCGSGSSRARPRGRIATAAAWRHAGRSPAAAEQALFDDPV